MRESLMIEDNDLNQAVRSGTAKVSITEYKKEQRTFMKRLESKPCEFYYTLRTEPFGWTVQRSLNDLNVLRKRLLMKHPGIVPPPVPAYSAATQLTDERQAECASLIIRFIEGCFRSPVLACDLFFKDFLSREQSMF